MPNRMRRFANVVDEFYIRRFTDAYVEAELWAGLVYMYDDFDEFNDPNPVPADSIDAPISSQTMADIAEECRDFVEGNRDLLNDLHAQFPSATAEQCGHDFSLTRNGHGAGFWDRGYGPIGDRLSDAARAYGETYWEFYGGELVSSNQ